MKTPVKSRKTGQVTESYDNGRLKFAGSLKNGKMHGAWKFYRRDGSVMRGGSFDQGRQIGVWKTFDRDGKLVKETSFGSKSSR